MRYLILLIFISCTTIAVFPQEKPPTQKGMQAQMLEAINVLNNQVLELEKQLAEAKKNKEDNTKIDLHSVTEYTDKSVSALIILIESYSSEILFLMD